MEAEPVNPIPENLPEPAMPNMFELSGRGVSIHFSTTSFTGDARFHYQDSCREVNASGEEIRQVETEMGTLVTLTLEPDADAGSLLFTVLIPRARVDGPEREVRIETQGILTRSRFARIPTDAQLQTYVVVPLRGRAALVDF
ncbi:hypothetical protein NR798_06300 [Archangium gephyra]|uniref:hypothetical protein n=1 Tax=Archangium gephyra TaxID=48 RepID=UPI0035D42D2A